MAARLALLHRWLGLLLSWLLLWVVLSGTLSLYRAELDQWQHPALWDQPALSSWDASLSTQSALLHLATHAPDARQWYLQLPTERQPYFTLHWQPAVAKAVPAVGSSRSVLYRQWLTADGRTELSSPEPVSAGDHRNELGGLFFHLHYGLLSSFGQSSRTVVAYLALLWLFVSCIGLCSLRPAFQQWWRHRRASLNSLQRHQLLGVLSLPFVIVFAATGWLMSMLQVQPAAIQSLYPQSVSPFYQELFPLPASPSSSMVATVEPAMVEAHWARLLQQLPALMATASHQWQGLSVGKITVQQPLQPEMQLNLQSSATDRVYNMPDLQSYQLQMLQTDPVLATELVWQQLPHVHSPAQQGWAAQQRNFWYGVHQALFVEQGWRGLLFVLGVFSAAVIWFGVSAWLRRYRAAFWSPWVKLSFMMIPVGMVLLLAVVPLLALNWPALLHALSLTHWLMICLAAALFLLVIVKYFLILFFRVVLL